MAQRRKTLLPNSRKRSSSSKGFVDTPKKEHERQYIEDHPSIRRLEAQTRRASPMAQSGIAGALLLQKGLLKTLGYEEKPRPPKLTLHIGDEEDRERYRHMLSSATDTPKSSIPMGGRCCGSRRRKDHSHK